MKEADLIVGSHYILTEEATVAGHDDECGVTFPKDTIFTFNGQRDDYNHFTAHGLSIYFWTSGGSEFFNVLEPVR